MQDRRRFHMTMPAWADRRRPGQACGSEDLFASGAADNWEKLNRQPVAALVRPSTPDDERVPVVRMGAGQDLDAIAEAFAADSRGSTD